MKQLASILATLVLAIFDLPVPGAEQTVLFASDFQGPLAKEWRMIGGTWDLKDGCLRQTDPQPPDPTKAIIMAGDLEDVSSDITLTAKLRLDTWREGDWARAGIGVCADPTTGHGCGLVFHQGKLEFVHDYIAWGSNVKFACRTGVWYWMKLSKKAGELRGKAWLETDPEPANWMITWQRPDETVTGYPALVGGSGGAGEDICTVSFARCQITVGASLVKFYTKKSTWLETMAASREALAREEGALVTKGLFDTLTENSRSASRNLLWRWLQRDFSEPASLREMTAEQRDNIWAQDWPFGTPSVLAERYAKATRAGMAEQAQTLARNVKTLADLDPLRRLYHRARDLEALFARWKEADVESLRLAVEDLSRTYGARYPKGSEYLQRLALLQKALAGGRSSASTNPGPFFAAVQQFEALRAEALLANPLLDFQQLLLVKRKDARAYHPVPRFPIPPLANGPGHLLNGLPLNYQGNGVLRQVPIENEIAVLAPLRPDGRLTTVFHPRKPAFVGDLKLHFDADRVLFSSIGTHDRFQIFEATVDGQRVRQVTRGDETDVDSYDSCYLPNDRILFGSSACFQSVPCERRHDEVANLCLISSDGSGLRRLCFDQDHNFYPTMLSDGRVLYTRWEYTDIAHAFSARLFTMNPDGTGQRAYYASSSFWPNRIFFAKQVPEHPTKFVGIITGHHGTPRSGELVLFDVAQGRRLAEGAVQRIPGRGKKVEAILQDTLVDGAWPKFLHPQPLNDKYFLVSCQPTPQSAWGIYLVDVFDNMLLLHEEEGWMMLEPVPIRKTPRPPLIPDRTTPGAQEGTVYLSDIYAGEGLKGIPRGTVRQLRLFTYHFNYLGTSGIEDYIGMDGPWDVRRVLGTVPVSADGSAHFIVPANTPIAVQPLDAEGKALQLMRSWFTAMPGESVACVGCHERLNDTPLDRTPRAFAGEPSRITPWHGPVRGFSWDREVQPVLDKYCVGCHNGKEPPPEFRAERELGGKLPPDLRRAAPQKLPLSDAPFPPSFYALRRFVRCPGLEGDPRVLPVADYHADTSSLVQMLRKGHHRVQLDAESWDRLVTWIDMNAPAYGTWLEIPGVQGNPLVRLSRERRIECRRIYGGLEEDPEAVPEVTREPIVPVMPPVMAPTETPRLAGWPFSAEQAKRKQASAGGQTTLEVDLGAGIKLQLARIPAGQFVMGGAAGYADEQPASPVKIDQPFWIGKMEVNNEQYARFDPTHRSGVEPMVWLKWSWEDYVDLGKSHQPICRVSYEEAAAFCAWLSQKTGRTFSLPSEAQWEWACRAGTDTALNFGPIGANSAPFANLADASLLDSRGWTRTLAPFSRTERVRPFYAADPVDDHNAVSAPVGSYQPNAWGLHDMHGNVAEWTRSAYLPYPFRADDPRHLDPAARKVVRGGSWYTRADLARSGCRNSHWPWQRMFDVGFRVVCEMGGPKETVRAVQSASSLSASLSAGYVHSRPPKELPD